jgi:biotin transport system permease protein
MISFYCPGVSPLHRMNAGVKLMILCLGGVGVMFLPSSTILCLLLVIILGCYALAQIPMGTLWRLSRSVVILVGIIMGFQMLFSSWQVAVLVGLRIMILILVANLVTLTTAMDKLIDIVQWVMQPLKPFGVQPHRIGIAVSLTLRFIPVVVEQGAKIRQAQAARGVRAPWTFLVPLIIRSLKMADGIGEALEVRTSGLEENSRK